MSKSKHSALYSDEAKEGSKVSDATFVKGDPMPSPTPSDSAGAGATSKASNLARGVTMLQWMWIFRIFILVGVTIFTIGQLSGTPDGNLAAYIWFMVGLLASWILAMRLMAVSSSRKSGFSATLDSLSVMLPNLGTLIPLSILIFITLKIRPILTKDSNLLPPKFFWMNRFTFFLVVMQLFILHKFYQGEADSSKQNDSWRSVWVGAIILFSVLTSAAAVELFVIVTSFITDG